MLYTAHNASPSKSESCGDGEEVERGEGSTRLEEYLINNNKTPKTRPLVVQGIVAVLLFTYKASNDSSNPLSRTLVVLFLCTEIQ